MPKSHEDPRPLLWVGSAKKDLQTMPDEVQDTFGYALHLAQTGGKHAQAKVLKGFGSAGVLEVVESEAGSTYRAVYTDQDRRVCVCAALLPEKIHLRHCHPQA